MKLTQHVVVFVLGVFAGSVLFPSPQVPAARSETEPSPTTPPAPPASAPHVSGPDAALAAANPAPPTKSGAASAGFGAEMAFAEAARGTSTDKVRIHRYDHFYDRLFRVLAPPGAPRPLRILEVGIGDGGSFHTFSRLFGGSPATGRFFYRGVDIRKCSDGNSVDANTLLPKPLRDELCRGSDDTAPGAGQPPAFAPAGANALLKVKRSQCVYEDLHVLIDNAPDNGGVLGPNEEGFDLIIDDASHLSECAALTFAELFPSRLLRPGGALVVEDLAFMLLPGWQRPPGKSTPSTTAGDRIVGGALAANATGQQLLATPLANSLLGVVTDMHHDALLRLSGMREQRWTLGKKWRAAPPQWPFRGAVQRVECERGICAVWKKAAAAPDPK